MICREPPYELLVLLADQDALALLCGLIERGQQRGCIRPFRWHPQRNAKGRHDDFWRHPEELLPPSLATSCRMILVWDHQGSGRETIMPAHAEQEALAMLDRQGVSAERALTIALQPELEILLAPVWERVKEVLAQERKVAAPADSVVLLRAQRLLKTPLPAGVSFSEALQKYPKELLEALRQLLRLGTLATVHQILGERLSIPQLKGEGGDLERPASRIARQLVQWFPGSQAQGPGLS